MNRLAALLYGTIAYLVFLVSFLYAIGFVGGFVVPKTIDSAPSSGLLVALPVNLALLTLFALQHSIMARPGFKLWWTRFVPAAVERSTYVLLASSILLLLYWQWRPLPQMVWSVEHQVGRLALWMLFALGWTLVLVSTFLISHAHLFGVQQVIRHAQGRPQPTAEFRTPGLYRQLRHPIMTGFLIAFWATPEMSLGHLLFALATTGYILVALRFEERDLQDAFGDRYAAYRRQVPMLIPFLRPRRVTTSDAESTLR